MVWRSGQSSDRPDGPTGDGSVVDSSAGDRSAGDRSATGGSTANGTDPEGPGRDSGADHGTDSASSERSTDDPTAEESAAGTALIADDESELRDVFRLWLAGEGWEVREATDGAEALKKLDDAVDVLVTDREMPNCGGPEVLDRLGETTFDGGVIVVSGRRPDSRLGRDDVAGYVTKPVTREEFVARVDAIDR